VAHLAGPGPEVEDLVQEVFIIACRRLESFRGDAKASTWLYGIARNVVRNHRRLARLRKLLPFSDTHREEEIPSETPAADHEIERRERERLVYEILDGMSEKYRTVLILFELEGLAGRAIAERIGLEESTVFVQLHRARKQFLERLQKIEGGR
jgi:RNA polymerase sigma-70 factor (ECF subfamily)